MELNNLALTPSVAAFSIGGISLVCLLLWLLIRIRQIRIWLPTVRVLNLESTLLPKIRLVRPPVLEFFCCLLSVIALVFFSFRPQSDIYAPVEPDQIHAHIFLDLSPSTSASTRIGGYADRVGELWSSLQGSARVTMSTSHSNESVEPTSEQHVEDLVLKLGFHRSGVRIGASLHGQLEGLGKVDRLIIVSDRNLHSWGDFNWTYLLDDMDVFFVDGRKQGVDAGNIFINGANFLSPPSSLTMDWDIEMISRGSDVYMNSNRKGILKATYQGKTLASVSWEFPPEKSKISVRASWPVTNLVGIDGVKNAEFMVNRSHLVWSAEGMRDDTILLDNQFRTGLRGLGRKAILIGRNSGERDLDDALHQLQVSLDVSGFRVRRFDRVDQPGPKAEKYPLWLVAGGDGEGINNFCPQSLIRFRHISGLASQGGVKVWLLPYGEQADYGDLCWCYDRLLKSKSETSPKPRYCKDVSDQRSYVRFLKSQGAKQVGGDISDERGAIAWLSKHQSTGLEVLSFAIPLKPSRRTGIKHSMLPVLVNQLLKWQGVIDDQQSNHRWPRIDDRSRYLVGRIRSEGISISHRLPSNLSSVNSDTSPGAASVDEPLDAVADGSEVLPRQHSGGVAGDGSVALGESASATHAILATSNIPFGESNEETVSLEKLPPQWDSSGSMAQRQKKYKETRRRQRQDPVPWVLLCVFLVLFAVFIEGAWTGGWVLYRVFSKKRNSIMFLLLILPPLALAVVVAAPAEAKVELSIIQRNGVRPTWKSLSQEISHRTSLGLASQALFWQDPSERALEQPWIWVNSLERITNRSGDLSPDIVFWLKRGGLLILQGLHSPGDLANLTRQAFRNQATKSQWNAIPPDHVLMRSFYLLDSLPSCRGKIWTGFHFDGRLAILSIPYDFLSALADPGGAVDISPAPDSCGSESATGHAVRRFINLLMVALATDYKKDQIHLPEILKRIR